MLSEIIPSIIIGLLAGTFTGLIPGIHTNLLTALLITSSLPLLTIFTPLALAVLIISMAITHTFTSAIPSIFLGAPDESMALAALPGHQLLLQGKGHHAVYFTIIGSTAAIITTAILTPILIPFLKTAYPLIRNFIPFILIIASTTLILKERSSKFWALALFLLAGALGIATFSLPINQPFLPLLTGLFGTPLLLLSITNKTKIPPQKTTRPKIKLKTLTRIIPRGGIASLLCAFLPGLGASQAAILALPTKKQVTKSQFLILIGSINTFVMFFCLLTLYSISKARNGAIIAISQILTTPSSHTLTALTTQHLTTLIIALLVSSLLAAIATAFISKKIALIIPKINYTAISLITIFFLILITLLISNWLGLLVLLTATSIGLLPTTKHIRKSHLMGCLIIPVILNSFL